MLLGSGLGTLADNQHFQRTMRAVQREGFEVFLRRVPPARAAGAYSVYEGAVPGVRRTSCIPRVLGFQGLEGFLRRVPPARAAGA